MDSFKKISFFKIFKIILSPNNIYLSSIKQSVMSLSTFSFTYQKIMSGMGLSVNGSDIWDLSDQESSTRGQE